MYQGNLFTSSFYGCPDIIYQLTALIYNNDIKYSEFFSVFNFTF